MAKKNMLRWAKFKIIMEKKNNFSMGVCYFGKNAGVLFAMRRKTCIFVKDKQRFGT